MFVFITNHLEVYCGRTQVKCWLQEAGLWDARQWSISSKSWLDRLDCLLNGIPKSDLHKHLMTELLPKMGNNLSETTSLGKP